MTKTKRRDPNEIYFSEISDKIAGKFLSYMSFEKVSVSVKKYGKNLHFLVLQDGKFGRHIERLDENGFVTISVRYSWHISIINPKIDSLINSEYDDVEISIIKPFLFRGIKIKVRNMLGEEVLSFRATKVILERVDVD